MMTSESRMGYHGEVGIDRFELFRDLDIYTLLFLRLRLTHGDSPFFPHSAPGTRLLHFLKVHPGHLAPHTLHIDGEGGPVEEGKRVGHWVAEAIKGILAVPISYRDG